MKRPSTAIRAWAALAASIAALAALAAAALGARAVADGASGPPAGTFSYGVAAGDVGARGAILWGRADQAGTVTLELARDRRFRRLVRRYRVNARRADDFTLGRRARGLRPGTRYWFRFRKGPGRSATGTFRTAPRAGASAAVEFAWSGDTDLSSAPGGRRSFWNQGQVFRRMLAERNDFNVHLGDTIYSDSSVPGRLRPIALSVPAKWAKYKTNLGNRWLRALRGAAPFYSHWDDHEFVNDFSPAESSFSNGVRIDGRVLLRRGARAFRDYAPVGWSSRAGLYRSFRWGRNLELFFLDERSFRSAKADQGGACDNPATGRPDIAPTAPQANRNVFGAALPSTGLSLPPPRRCLDTIRSARRTFLGRRQMVRFKRAIARSTARWKVVVNETPIQQFYMLPYDRWEGYEAERQELLRHLRRNVRNAIFLTTDVHATLVNQARLRTLEPGGPESSGFYDFTVGPVATGTFDLQIDRVVGGPTGGELVKSGFLTPPPPTGVGMRCSNIDTFSYGQVRVTRDALTVTAKDPNGRRLADCPPLTLRHRR